LEQGSDIQTYVHDFLHQLYVQPIYKNITCCIDVCITDLKKNITLT